MAGEIELTDANSASVSKKPWAWREIATFLISYTVVVGFFALWFTGRIPDKEIQIAVGAIIGWVGASLNYYNGTSQSSTVKGEAQNQTIEKLAAK